jgi:hypothetical protein
LKNNLTVKELAIRARVKYHTICVYKNIVKNSNPVTLHKLATVFGYNIKYFIDFDISKMYDKIKYLRITEIIFAPEPYFLWIIS